MKAKRKRLIMNRTGEFSVETYGDSHCGIDNWLDIQYVFKIECSTTTDARGFLFDQLTVDHYFRNIRRTRLSCEKLCIQSLKKLIKIIMEENPACQVCKAELNLSAYPYAASMTYSVEF